MNDLERNIISTSKESGYKETGKFIQRILPPDDIIAALISIIKNKNAGYYEKHDEF